MFYIEIDWNILNDQTSTQYACNWIGLKIWLKQINPKTANCTIYVYVICMCYVLVKALTAVWMFERSELSSVSKIR